MVMEIREGEKIMNKDIRFLIVPDVHGRDFWMTPVKETLENTDAHIVFLGDLLDPYPQEWEEGVDYRRVSISRFQEILELKKAYPERMTLLIGNHDCGYAIGQDICRSRTDLANRKEIAGIFETHVEDFQIAYECSLGGKRIIFSHAGILKGWVKEVWGEEADEPGFNPVEKLNQAWREGDYHILYCLGIYDGFRGWGGSPFGSPVWSDIRAWVNLSQEDTYGYNICGHTQTKENPVILETIADLDCRKVFYLDTDGHIRDYESDRVWKPSEV